MNPGVFEAFIVVAFAALTAEIALVNIIPIVTFDAIRGIAAFFQRSIVTGMTMQLAVRTVEAEVGLVMIELPDQPGVGIVAYRAIRAQCLLVHIVVFVAFDTVGTGIGKFRRAVAGFAAQHGMLADQRKGG